MVSTRSFFTLLFLIIAPSVLFSNPTNPLILLPDRSLEDLFDYNPEYTQNIVTFDSLGRPYIRSRTSDIDETEFIHTYRDGKWVKIPLLPTLRAAYPNFINAHRSGGTSDTRIIFDREDRFYTLLTIRLKDEPGKTVMLYSTDFGKTIDLVEVPRDAVPAEHVSGQNELSGPPLLMRSERRNITLPGDWARVNHLYILQPRWEESRIVIPEPIHVTDMLVSIGQHSGGSSFAVTRDGKTHLVWAEVTEDPNAPGSPTFIATFDQNSEELSKPIFLAHARPLNNSHNVPGICIDGEGYLHVVTGAHYGQSFFYTRSLLPNRIDAGWTDPEPVWATGWKATTGEEAGGQTYVSLVCDPDDTLHLVFRHWQRRSTEFPHLAEQNGRYFAALAHQKKPKGESWSEPRTLIIPARNIYSIYYQKLSVSPTGSLFLSASYMDRVLLERSSTERFLKRMILTSSDGGESWRFAENSDFAASAE